MSRARGQGKRRSRRRGDDGGSRRDESASRRISTTAWEWGKTLLITVVLLMVIRTFLIQTFVIISGSMEDTLLVGDFLMVNRLALGAQVPGTSLRTPGYSEPHRGDVLIPGQKPGFQILGVRGTIAHRGPCDVLLLLL